MKIHGRPDSAPKPPLGPALRYLLRKLTGWGALLSLLALLIWQPEGPAWGGLPFILFLTWSVLYLVHKREQRAAGRRERGPTVGQARALDSLLRRM